MTHIEANLEVVLNVPHLTYHGFPVGFEFAIFITFLFYVC